MPRTKQFNEEEVLEKAMNLFWKQGYNATSIQEIVNHLGINRASLYHTFGGKEALFDKSFQKYLEQGRTTILHFLNSQESVKEGIKQLMSYAVQEAEEDCDKKGCFAVNTTTELSTCNNQISNALENHNRNLEKIFYEYLQKGVAQNEISDQKDLKALATFIYALYSGIKVMSKIEYDRQNMLNMIDLSMLIFD